MKSIYGNIITTYSNTKKYKQLSFSTFIWTTPRCQRQSLFLFFQIVQKIHKEIVFKTFLRFLPTNESCQPRRVSLTDKDKTQDTLKRTKGNYHNTLALNVLIMLHVTLPWDPYGLKSFEVLDFLVSMFKMIKVGVGPWMFFLLEGFMHCIMFYLLQGHTHHLVRQWFVPNGVIWKRSLKVGRLKRINLNKSWKELC